MNVIEEQTRIITDTILLRTLTFKSKLKYGDNAHLTVQDVLNVHRHSDLAYAYYNMSNISFKDEVLDKIGIKPKESKKL